MCSCDSFLISFTAVFTVEVVTRPTDWANPLPDSASSSNVPLVILPPDIAKRPVTTIAMLAIKVRINPKPIETNPPNSEVNSLPLKVANNETNVEIKPATMMIVEKVLFKGY